MKCKINNYLNHVRVRQRQGVHGNALLLTLAFCLFGIMNVQAQITGSSNVCVGSTVRFTDANPGGSWSSDNVAVGSVEPTTGEVAGVSAGTATISYVLGGVTETAIITVDPTPPPISGPPTLCVGAVGTYTNSMGGGYWMSTIPGTAYFYDAFIGDLTTFTGGYTSVFYTITATGCRTIKNIVIDPIPTITGVKEACSGATTNLYAYPTGGDWSSATTSVATIDVATGEVTGVSAGTALISYLMPSGCLGTTGVRISTPPSAISGATSLCAGATTTFTNSVSGGTWSSSDPSTATVSAGLVTGIAYGISTITYATNSNCYVTKDITINPAPPADITGNNRLCAGNTTVLSDATSGGTWSSSNPSIATINSSGVVSALTRGSTLISYTVSTSCGTSSRVRAMNVDQSTEWDWVTSAPATVSSSTTNYGQSPVVTDAIGNVYTITKFIGSATYGSYSFTSSFAGNVVVAKYTSTGYCLWARTFGADMGAVGDAIALDPSGYVYITGSFKATAGSTISIGSRTLTGTGNMEGFVVKYDDMGTAMWARQTTGGHYIYTSMNSIYADASGNSYVTGRAATPGLSFGSGATLSGAGIFAVKYDNAGNVIWTNSLSNNFESSGTAIDMDASGNLFISGWMMGTDTFNLGSGSTIYSGIGYRDAVIMKLNSSGVCQWVKQYGGPRPTSGYGDLSSIARLIKVSSTGNIYISGEFGNTINFGGISLNRSNSLIQETAFLAKLDANGDPIWAKQARNTSDRTFCYGMALNAAQEVVVGGVHWGTMDFGNEHFTGAGHNAFVAKFDTMGNCDWGTSVGSGYTDGDPSITGLAIDINDNVIAVGVQTSSVAFGCASTSGSDSSAFVAKLTKICASSIAVCEGNTIYIPAVVSGGTFSISGTAAIIDPTTGMLTGVSAGTAIATFSAPYTCQRITNVTVNGISTITGVSSLCTGATSTLTPSVTGGIWSSSNTAVVTVGSTTGVISAVTFGTSIISYTLGGGCYTTHVVTVNPFPPAPITGSLNLCTGDVVTLTDDSLGGTWTSTNPSVATISSGGIVTVVSSGSTLIMYTISSTCGSTVSTSSMINVGQNNKWEWANSAGSTNGDYINHVLNSSAIATDAAGNSWVTGTFMGTATFGTHTITAPHFGWQAVFVAKYNTSGDCLWVKCFGGTYGPGVTDINTGRGISVDAAGNCYVTGGYVDPVGSSITFASDVLNGNGGTQLFLVKYDNSGNEVWARQMTTDGSPNHEVFGIETDASGNSYITGGSAYDDITFGSITVPAGSFAAKYDASGNVVWATRISDGYYTGAVSISFDASGNSYIAGYKEGTRTFNTSTPTTLTAIGDRDAFIGKINASGVLQWVEHFGDALSGIPTYGKFCIGKAIKVDASGNLYVAGDYYSLITIGATTLTKSNTSAVGVFLAKFDNNGNPIWVKGSNGTGYSIYAHSIVLNSADEPIIAGGSAGNNNFGPANGPQIVGDNVAYVAKFDASGNCNWTRNSYGVYGIVEAYGIDIDASDNIYISGNSWSTAAPFGCSVLTAYGGVDLFVAKLGPNCAPITLMAGPALCLSASTTLTDATSGGTWSTNSASVTVGASSGFVSSIAAGTALVSYTTPYGCVRTTTLAINPLPASITGGTNVCLGSNLSLASATPGGLWSSSDESVATVGSGTGTVNGISVGNATITYAVSATGCYTTTYITVNPAAAIVGSPQVCTGQTTSLNNIVPGGTWQSSNTGVATIGISTGTATGVSAGNAIITYTNYLGCRSVMTLSVNGVAAISGVSSLCQGNTSVLTDATTGGTWLSDNSSIATIGSGTGLLSGLSGGVVNISYTSGLGCIAIKAVTVNPIGAISGPSIVCVGQTITLTNPAAGGVWTSSAPTVASIGAGTGIVSGIAAGLTTNITYTTGGSCRATMTVSVNALGTIGGPTSVCQGQTITKTNSTSGGTWSSSATGVATIGTGGIVMGISGGTAIISYTLPSGCIGTSVVTVNAIEPISGPSTVCNGQTMTLTDLTGGGTWSSGSPTIATVGLTTGIVTGLAANLTSNITYTVGSGCRSIKTITVNALSAISGLTSVCVGQTITLTDATAGGSWTSDNTSIGTIGTGNGIVTGVSAGTVNIFYSLASGCTATMAVVVNNLVPTTGPNTVCVGQTITLTNSGGGVWSSGSPTIATVVPSTGVVTGVAGNLTANITYTLGSGCRTSYTITVNPLGVIAGPVSVCEGQSITLSNTGGGTWSTPNSNVTIGLSTGLVNGLTAGTALISYSLASGCIATRVLTVNPLAPITGASQVCFGSMITLGNILNGGVWTSGSPTIASVIAGTGVVTGVAGGLTALISYTMGTGCRSTYTVTVNALPTVAAISGASSVSISGAPITLTDATSGGVWTSSNNARATVAGGVVTGHAVGLVTITYSVTNAAGCVNFVTKNVTVGPANPNSETLSDTLSIIVGNSAVLNGNNAIGSWSEDGNGSIHLDAETGVITGIRVGATTITYTTQDETGIHTIIQPVVINTTKKPIENTNASMDVLLLPNPNSGEFTIKGSILNQADEELNMEVSNMLGQIVYKGKVQLINGQINENVKLSNELANGSYLLHLKSTSEHVTLHFVIKK